LYGFGQRCVARGVKLKTAGCLAEVKSTKNGVGNATACPALA
jgi:hypothetical protein